MLRRMASGFGQMCDVSTFRWHLSLDLVETLMG
jgi:hypothetical protein